ncbi:MAG TPA: ATP-binding cassette domain-containing protein [Acidimicrobiia bacterium]|nr:ATP-binding cassette domain-containing protein [Acidimicrobiia bacterium]
MSDPLLAAHDIGVRFGGIVALEAVDLTVPAASLTGLVGPNGAGKTTLFGVLSGLLRPRTGRVLLDGVDVTGASPQRRSRLGLARTFQRLELFTELTVREQLVVARRIHDRRDRTLLRDVVGLGQRPSRGEDEAVDALLELLDLRAVAFEPAATVGFGTGRIVELGRALATEPRVVLLDEPTSGLDVQETARVAAALGVARAERGVAFVLVEHDVELVLDVCDAVTVLDFGRVIAHGAPEAIRASAEVQAAYLGTADVGTAPA